MDSNSGLAPLKYDAQAVITLLDLNCRLRFGFTSKRDIETEAGQFVYEALLQTLGVQSIEVIGAKVPIWVSTFEKLIGDDQHAVRYGDYRPFLPLSNDHATILCAELSIFGPGSCPGCLAECAS